MKTDNLKDLFDQLDFDVAEPPVQHEERFREKLRNQPGRKTKRSGVITLWLPVMAVAASLFMAFLLFQGVLNDPFSQRTELANVSPEMKETQNFYASVIKNELENLEAQKTPETEAVIADALNQLEILEKDYEKLKKDLQKSGQDKRVIYAMISNFQQRIDLLNTVLEKVETINTLKNSPHENSII
ncbi:DUF4179 domain-containing protein [Salinimicrobium flavum]|uniref:DUF4179 domain-containing protein n=1 Tax=Salinimicrobium flavum TaxID=1737065 RepID=A0ABW5J039_9FLAO